MTSLFTIALMFKAFDAVTAPVNKINATLDTTGKTLERATGKSTALNRGVERLGRGATVADRLARGVERIGTAAAAATARLEAMHRQAEKLGEQAQKLEGLGRPMAAIGAISTVGIQKAISEFATLEEAQNRLKTNLMDHAGNVGVEFENLNRLAEKLGSDLPGDTKDMVELFTALREQGVQTNMILGGMGEATAKFATVMKLPFAEAATHVAKFSESMGVADKDANEFMDTLQRIKAASGVEAGDLAYTFKYAGGALKLLNLQGIEAARSFSTVVGMLANAGIEGSTAGTNMAQALSRMAEVGDKLEKKNIRKLIGPILDMHDIKLNFFDAEGQFRGLREMVGELEKLNVLNAQDQVITLKKLFGDEAARPLAILVKAGVEGYNSMTKRLEDQADMMQKIKTIMGGTAMKWETMTGTVANLVTHVGGVFAGLIKLPALLDKLNDLFGKMDEWVLANPRTAGVLAGVVLGLTTISLAGGAVLLTIAGMGRVIPAALEGLVTLGKGTSFATARVAALATQLKGMKNIPMFVAGMAEGMFGELVVQARAARSGIYAASLSMKAWTVAQLAAFRTNFLTISGLRGLAVSFGSTLVSGIRTAILAIRAFSITLLTSPIGWIGLALAGAALLIYKFWRPISGFFKGLWIGLKEGLKGLQPAWDVFKRVAPLFAPILVPLRLIMNAVKALLKPVDDTGSAAQNMGVRFGKALAGILTFVATLPTKMLSAGFNIINSLFEGMQRGIKKPVELMKGLAQRLRNFLPFSPAKEGALKDINRIRLVETIAESITPAPMVRAMKGVTAAALIAATPVTQQANIPPQLQGLDSATPLRSVRNDKTIPHPPHSTASGRGGLNAATITFSPVINITSAANPAEVRSQVDQALQLSQVEFEKMLARAEQNQKRKGFV